ncbi:MAG: bifunctional DNA primase/polymerase [Candidatus Acidiferrales bacterium]
MSSPILDIVQLCDHGRIAPCEKCLAAASVASVAPSGTKTLLDYALGAVHRGWYVFPCWPKSKAPATEHGYKDSSNDEAQIRAWWTQNPIYNIGIDLGRSNLVVFDFDKVLPFGIHANAATYTVRTGRDAAKNNGIPGTQIYYTGSAKTHGFDKDGNPVEAKDGKTNSVGEVRSRGALVVGAGSIHPLSGNPYTVLLDAPLLPSPEANVDAPRINRNAIGTDDQEEISGYVEDAFEESGIECCNGRQSYGGKQGIAFMWCIVCPWESEHTDKKDKRTDTSSAVIMYESGMLTYCCKHGHCENVRQWKELRPWMEEKVGHSLTFGVHSEGAVLFGSVQKSIEPVNPYAGMTAFVFETADEASYMKELGLKGVEQNTQSVEVLRQYERVLLFDVTAATKTLKAAIGGGASLFELPADEAAIPETRYGRKIYPRFKTAADAIRAHDNEFGGREALLEYFLGLEKLEAVRQLSTKAKSAPVVATIVQPANPSADDDSDTASIPPFNPRVMEGTIYEKFVHLVTDGTTMRPQFTYNIAKTIFGALLAGRIEFDKLSGTQPLRKLVLLGETGSGKGLAFKRSHEVVTRGRMANDQIKITHSIDSGVGLKDLFLQEPQHLPVLCYVAEALTLGHKSGDNRNPDILDVIGELADDYSFSRTKAARGKSKGSVTKNDAHLVTIICAQDGLTFMAATAGRKVAGFNDRNQPCFETAVKPGDRPAIKTKDILDWWLEADKILDMVGTRIKPGLVTMSTEASKAIEQYWDAQPKDIETKVRFKDYVLLDAYLNAVGRGRMEVSLRDAEDAIIESRRDLATRAACFQEEVSDRVQYYFAAIKRLVDRMARKIAAAGIGADPFEYGLSERDFFEDTGARNNNEGEQFTRAWKVWKNYLDKLPARQSRNHKMVTRYLPPTSERD